jgi:hypothetical protein
MRSLLLVTMASGLVPIPLPAQTPEPVTSFAELRREIRTDAALVVTLVSGERVRGRADVLEDARLSIRERDQVRWLREDDVARIDLRMRDSIKNGLIIGAAVGGGIFLNYYSENALCRSNCQFTSGALALVGMGAGIGAIIDALVARTTTVHERRDPPPRALMLFGVEGATRSVALRVSF